MMQQDNLPRIEENSFMNQLLIILGREIL